ncbi:MAG TPA: hypothetical protein VK557_15245 [Pyrinomonadaceae bacterium]|nr:hypothetical protein [Pyrinomonadaceae bacterium]
MSSGFDSCLTQNAKVLNPDREQGARSLLQVNHPDHTQMSEMDMQDMSMDMSDARMNDATSPPENNSTNTGESQVTGDEQPPSEAITQPTEPCSHCMMHSQSGASAPLIVVTQDSNSYQAVPAASVIRVGKTLSSALTFLDVHDHSPPGSSARLYVLVNAFRI